MSSPTHEPGSPPPTSAGPRTTTGDAPTIVIVVQLERRAPYVWISWDDDLDTRRMACWIRSNPELGNLLDLAADLVEAAERSA